MAFLALTADELALFDVKSEIVTVYLADDVESISLAGGV
jgi:hypothetical protein